MRSAGGLDETRRVSTRHGNALEMRRRCSRRYNAISTRHSVSAVADSRLPIRTPLLDEFIAWLREHAGLPGADAILERHDHHQNLQGHVKQSLFGLLRFFEEHPELVAPLSAGLDEARDGIYSPTPEVLGPWVTHLDDHATDAGDGWSYSTLRTQTPDYGRYSHWRRRQLGHPQAHVSARCPVPRSQLRPDAPDTAAYRERLRELLPELRQIEGFPIGTDEDILALIDPPYYTACPTHSSTSSSPSTARPTTRRPTTTTASRSPPM